MFVERWQGNANLTGEQAALSACGRWAAVHVDRHVKLIEIKSGNVVRDMPGNHARFSIGGDYVLVWRRDYQRRKSVDFAICNPTTGALRRLEQIQSIFERGGIDISRRAIDGVPESRFSFERVFSKVKLPQFL